MKELKNRILEDGKALNETVLKVDTFLNHQVDSKLMYNMGTYFKEYFKKHGITNTYYRKFRNSTNGYDCYANGFTYGNT